MPYTITGDSVGLAIDSMADTANDVHDALTKARQMYEDGLANVTITDQGGHKLHGDELLDCMMGKKRLTEDLQAQ